MTKFFVPHLRVGSDAEEAWSSYLDTSHATADDNARRLYSLTYEHEDSLYKVKVGEPRVRFRRRTGPRGGYIKDAPYSTSGTPTGTDVTAIVRAGNVIHVYSWGPSYGGWANPSFVGPDSITQSTYFEPVE